MTAAASRLNFCEQLKAGLVQRMPGQQDMPFRVVARQLLKIKTKQEQIVPFKLRPIQNYYLARKRLAIMQGKKPRYLLLKYRRGGFTTVEQGVSYFRSSRRRNANVITLAQDTDTTAKIFRIAQLMHRRDPKAPAIKGRGNSYKLEFPGINSMFSLGTAGGGSVARGDTLSRAHWSEVAWSCPGYNQRDKQQTLLADITEAASEGEVILETTPNGHDHFHELFMEALQGRNDWTAIFIRWFEDYTNRLAMSDPDERRHILTTLDDEERRLVDRHRATAEQIKWRRMKKRELKRLFYQEYPEDVNTCWLVSGTPFFDPQMLAHLAENMTSSMLYEDNVRGMIPEGCTHVPGGYQMIWHPPVPGVRYSLGADTSEGLPGCDPCGLGIMDPEGRQCASVHGLFNPRVLAHHIVRMHKMYNGALVGIERENHGHAVLLKVMDLGLRQSHRKGGRLYYHSGSKGKTDEEKRQKAGWSTNAVTRPLMLDGLNEWLDVEDPEIRVNDRHFLSECYSFRLQGKGRWEHDPGCHDDTIFKWAVANQMRTTKMRRPRIYVSTR